MKTAKRRRPRRARKPDARLLSVAQVAAAVRTMAQPSGTARFGAGKALSHTAERDARRVYPHFDAIAALLTADGKIVRWNAMSILAALAPVDGEHKLDAVVEPWLATIRGDNLVSAANAIRGLGAIAAARPDLKDRIVSGLLAVEGATYETPECRNVAIGQVLGVLDELGAPSSERVDVAGFVRRQVENPRAAVARRATHMLGNGKRR
ncbi:MAG: hypothetical protein U1D55_18960 [Phycisphaerae bacterium]